MAVTVLVVAALALALAPASALGSPAAHPSGQYIPQAGAQLKFSETITTTNGYGGDAGYTSTEYVNGSVNFTGTDLTNDTVNVSYDYPYHYTNNTGGNLRGSDYGSYSFDALTGAVYGNDGSYDQYAWVYEDNALGVDATFRMGNGTATVEGVDTSYGLNTTAGGYVEATYVDEVGTLSNSTNYGYNATYNWEAFFDPSTGYVLGYEYLEHDNDGDGDGFTYTDTLAATFTNFTLTAASGAAPTYPITFHGSGVSSGADWTVTFDGVPQTAAGPGTLVFHGVRDGTYSYTTNASGYSSNRSTGSVIVNGAAASVSVAFTAPPPSDAWIVYAVVAVVVVIVLVVVLFLLLRRRPRSSVPRHSPGGQVPYAPAPMGGAPPPINLQPGDQPKIQQVVVQEVVKVPCQYCGSLIDSTAQKCPFCGATRT